MLKNKIISLIDLCNIRKDATDWPFETKLFYTILLLVVYRIGVHIPIPFTNPELIRNAFKANGDSPFLQAFAMVGGSSQTLGVLALGVAPYITASILFSLIKNISPRLKTISETPEGQSKINQWTRYLSIPLSVLQSLGIVLGAPVLFRTNIYTEQGALPIVVGTAVMTAGALVAMRLGECITIRGVMNGTSLIISASILAHMPTLFVNVWVNHKIIGVVCLSAVLLATVSLATYVEHAEYRVPVIYPKTSMRRNVTPSNIPVKVAIAGVLPVIFSSSLLSMPSVLGQIWPNNHAISEANRVLAHNGVPYLVLYVLLTVALTFFSLAMTFDIHMISEQINHQGGFVVGKRPGFSTEAFLSFIANRMCFLDAVYLCVISMVTLQVFPLLGLTAGGFGATSVIILCTVTVTLLSAIEAESNMKSIRSFSLLGRGGLGKRK